MLFDWDFKFIAKIKLIVTDQTALQRNLMNIKHFKYLLIFRKRACFCPYLQEKLKL